MDKIRRTDDEWREKLTDDQYRIARHGATEPPFTGLYNDCKEPGVYRCVCCDAELFRSDDKFDSGSGWPSFTKPSENENVNTREDDSLGMRRIEIRCARCDAHLGHVFPDGPREAGGQRYCVNSGALKLDSRAGGE